MVSYEEHSLMRFPLDHGNTLHCLMHTKTGCTPLPPRHPLPLRLPQVLGAKGTWPLTAKNPNPSTRKGFPHRLDKANASQARWSHLVCQYSLQPCC